MEGKSQTMHLSAFRKNKNKILRGHPSSGQYGTIQSEQNQGRQRKKKEKKKKERDLTKFTKWTF